ncbi:hypothetical protein ACHAXS_001843 [Conticribra weissflogii]
MMMQNNVSCPVPLPTTFPNPPRPMMTTPRYPVSPLLLHESNSSRPQKRQRGQYHLSTRPRRTMATKRVCFSESATLHIYQFDLKYACTKAYNKADRKKFTQETFADVTRIKSALKHAPESSDDTPTSKLLESCGVDPDEAVGIEHLVFTSSPVIIFKARKLHVQAILAEQENQRQLGISSTGRLSRLSEFSSTRSTKEARSRASFGRNTVSATAA